jgi:hypothetical protein
MVQKQNEQLLNEEFIFQKLLMRPRYIPTQSVGMKDSLKGDLFIAAGTQSQ